jgi:hypothetical protein
MSDALAQMIQGWVHSSGLPGYVQAAILGEPVSTEQMTLDDA